VTGTRDQTCGGLVEILVAVANHGPRASGTTDSLRLYSVDGGGTRTLLDVQLLPRVPAGVRAGALLFEIPAAALVDEVSLVAEVLAGSGSAECDSSNNETTVALTELCF